MVYAVSHNVQRILMKHDITICAELLVTIFHGDRAICCWKVNIIMLLHMSTFSKGILPNIVLYLVQSEENKCSVLSNSIM